MADVGTRCYCGNVLSYATRRVSESVCSNVCMGNYSWICGGSNVLSLYEVEQPKIAVS